MMRAAPAHAEPFFLSAHHNVARICGEIKRFFRVSTTTCTWYVRTVYLPPSFAVMFTCLCTYSARTTRRMHVCMRALVFAVHNQISRLTFVPRFQQPHSWRRGWREREEKLVRSYVTHNGRKGEGEIINVSSLEVQRSRLRVTYKWQFCKVPVQYGCLQQPYFFHAWCVWYLRTKNTVCLYVSV